MPRVASVPALPLRLATAGWLGFLLLLVAPEASRAQEADFPPLPVGEWVAGLLTPADPRSDGMGPFQVMEFEAEAGRRYRLRWGVEGFDPVVRILRPVGGITETVMQGGEGLIRYTSPRSERLLVVMQSREEFAGGPFTLSLDVRSPNEAGSPLPILPSQPVEGAIGLESPLHVLEDGSEVGHDLWVFPGRGGDQYLISMESSDFQPAFEFGPTSAGTLVPTRSDGGWTPGPLVRLRVTLPHDGFFGIRARPRREDEGGRYVLRMDPWEPRALIRSPIRVGEAMWGVLSVEDPRLGGERPYHEWVLEGSEGEVVDIWLRSQAFDAWLDVGEEGEDGTFRLLDSNDDTEGRDAFVRLVLPRTGRYVIRATAYDEDSQGEYTVSVEQGG
jgi:hypothetical protein